MTPPSLGSSSLSTCVSTLDPASHSYPDGPCHPFGPSDMDSRTVPATRECRPDPPSPWCQVLPSGSRLQKGHTDRLRSRLGTGPRVFHNPLRRVPRTYRIYSVDLVVRGSVGGGLTPLGHSVLRTESYTTSVRPGSLLGSSWVFPIRGGWEPLYPDPPPPNHLQRAEGPSRDGECLLTSR